MTTAPAPPGATDSRVTVGAALRLPPLRRGAPEVVAGGIGLDRPIRWVHVGEVPNIASLLKGGELLLTTGLGIGRGAREQRAFVDALADRGVAALAIELGARFRELPAALVQAADRRGLPLIALRREVAFVEVTEAIHTAIVNRQLAVLRRGDELHRRFTELMLAGAGIPEVLAALASAIANPVLLEKAGHGVLFHATHRTGDEETLAAWAAARAEPEAGGALVLPVPGAAHAIWGRLVALALDSPLTDLDRAAAERAVALVALALLRAGQEELLAARERGNFLDELAGGRLEPADAGHRAAALGLAHDRGALVALAIALPEGAGGDPGWAPVWRDVRAALQAQGAGALVGTRERDALVLIGISAPARRPATVAVAAATVHDAVARHVGPTVSVTVAAGPAVDAWPQAPEALREAAATADVARGAHARAWHEVADWDLERLLRRLRGDAATRAFAERRLGPLLEHDRRRAAKLLPTLAAFCEHGGRKAPTARALHLERQSLYHRLRRIEALLGADLDDADTRLGLQLALRCGPGVDG